MATTRLSDIIDVTIFRDLPQIEGPEKTRFFESGIITRNSLLDELANAPGKSIELPYWNDLDGSTEVNYSSDDPASSATPQKITQGEQIARKSFVNQAGRLLIWRLNWQWVALQWKPFVPAQTVTLHASGSAV